MEFPDRIWRALSALNATHPITWTIQVKDEGGVQLTVDLGEERQPPSRRGSTFRGGNPSHTGPHTKDGKHLLDVDVDKKKKKKRKKGPSARRRDARRLTEFMEKKRQEKEEKEREKSVDHSTPQTPSAPKSTPDISSKEVMPEDSGTLEATLTSTPTRSSSEDGLEEEGMSFVDEEESVEAPLISSDPRSPDLSDRNSGKESDESEPEEEPWTKDMELYIQDVRGEYSHYPTEMVDRVMDLKRKTWLLDHRMEYTETSARARAYTPKQTPSISCQVTPPKKKKSPSQPPPNKKKKKKHRN